MSWLSSAWDWTINTLPILVAFVLWAGYLLRPLYRAVASFLRRRGLLERLSARLGTDKVTIKLPDGQTVAVSNSLSAEQIRTLLHDVVASDRADAERRVREALEREEAERRLAEYTKRREAEYWLGPYLPANVRRAKRLINHERLYVMIAEDRGVFGGSPALTHQHLAKWVLIVEHWPRLGAALVREPRLIEDLEQAETVAQLQNALDSAVPGVQASEDLFEVLRDGVPLRHVLARLVRFEPADAPVADG